RTGDQTVLPGLQELCDWCIDNQAAGGWGHGEGVGPGYVQSGLMNHAGAPILITLILSQECGINVEPIAYANAMKLMYRMAGHGCIAYGDHRSELWWSNTNGRNSMLACAFSLLNEHPQYQAASQHLARLVTDSYFQPEFGHTGGGFNVIWRGIASVHVPKTQQYYYHRQMKALTWYYDLTRQPGGGFSILPTPPDNGRYSGVDWGTGAIGLTYTAPRRTLRITGAPRTQHSVSSKPPAFVWGNANDLRFLSTRGPRDYGPDIDHPDEIYSKLLEDKDNAPTVAYCIKYMRHYSPLVRTWAGRRLGEMKTPKAIAALRKASLHTDPRVRRAAFDAISGYDNWRRPIRGRLPAEVVSEQFLDQILQTLNDEASAWWEIDGALFALGQAEPDDIRKQLPTIRRFTTHEDWYLREAAFWAIVGLHADIRGEEFELLSQMYEQSQHVFERASFDSGFQTILKSDKAAFDRATLINAAKFLGKTTHTPKIMLGYGTGGVHEAAHRTMMVLKHFDPKIYPLMLDDFVLYLKNWQPYYQHSIWLIKGSNWQPGILRILKDLGPEGQPLVNQLERIERDYKQFDQSRIPRDATNLADLIATAVQEWKVKQTDN
ncbi:HEAT repeat domain-containing protein, partial [bacterium]|nr:HEAT repeat domain-containing protein [bacterium]